ncbi:MAG: maleylpyruvate isomerase family mycothiol-dependent enzyme [Actinomycetota bacterium]
MAVGLSGAEMLGALEREAARIAEVVTAEGLAEPVPRLGRWKVRDVVAHLGGVHEWAARIVRDRSRDGPGFRKSKLDGDELLTWFADGAADLITVLGDADLDDPCPNFNPGSEPTVGWWLRRQLHETAVHRWDIERALDALSSIEPDQALDAVGEFLDVYVRTRGKHVLDAPLVIESTEPAAQWLLTPAKKPGRIDVETLDGHEANADSSVVGPPEGLLLALWGRLTVAEAGLALTGDANVTSLLQIDSG